MPFKFYKQLDAKDCGLACLRMIAKYYGLPISLNHLKALSGFTNQEASLLSLSETAGKIGFKTKGMLLGLSELSEKGGPCILHWNQNHFVIFLSYKKSSIKIADPSKGIIDYSEKEFAEFWFSNSEELGIALILEPSDTFLQQKSSKSNAINWKLISKHLVGENNRIAAVFITLIITSLFQLAFPFLTQDIVDKGVKPKNIHFVLIVLLAQLMLTFSRVAIDFFRSRLLLRISNNFNFSILSDFWLKLTKLPIAYFENHPPGETIQRLGDQRQIQNFLTYTTLTTIFSVFNFIVYGIVLMTYSVFLFFIFVAGSIIYFSWVQFFLKFTRKVNYETFELSSQENTSSLQLIQGMQELRLNNAETQKRLAWENLQNRLIKLNFKNLNYSQFQEAGAMLISQIQNLTISFIVAKLVIDGKLTLGAMLAVQYVIGQLSGPIIQWVNFVQRGQDAKISLERLDQIHQIETEEDPKRNYINKIDIEKDIVFQNVSFTYTQNEDNALKNINLYVPKGKITAIVGESGSGKSTLLKLLLKIYDNYEGEITLSNYEPNIAVRSSSLNFHDIRPSYWHSLCGAVMQDGFIFNDTIKNNIALGIENIQEDILINSCKIANLINFIDTLPNGLNTVIGAGGVGLSQGQRQRVLIARAVYKNPSYLFLDEATNSLDSNTEKLITENLSSFFYRKTVVIVAHRLSTVRNADKIIVLDHGRIIEEGTHDYLISVKRRYFELVKSQLDLGIQ